jgi:hypothetical protein
MREVKGNRANHKNIEIHPKTISLIVPSFFLDSLYIHVTSIVANISILIAALLHHPTHLNKKNTSPI